MRCQISNGFDRPMLPSQAMIMSKNCKEYMQYGNMDMFQQYLKSHTHVHLNL